MGPVLYRLGKLFSFLPEDFRVNIAMNNSKTKSEKSFTLLLQKTFESSWNKLFNHAKLKFLTGLIHNYGGDRSFVKTFFYGENKYQLKTYFNSFVGRRNFYREDIQHRELAELLKKYLKKEDHYIDIGANIGETCLIASFFCDNIVAFEPVMGNYLEENIKLNQTELSGKNLKFFPYALSDCNDEIDIQIATSDGGHTINPDNFKKRPKGFFIKTKKITAKKFDDLNIKANFVKIDTEGHEYEVLKGMVNSLSDIDYIFCEVFYKNYSKVNQLLNKFGFYHEPIDIPKTAIDIFYKKRNVL